MRATSCSHFASGLPSWLFMACVLVMSASTIRVQAQEPDTHDVRLFRFINSQQNPDKTGFFEILDYTSLPSYGAVPLGFLAAGGFGSQARELQTGLMLVVSEGLTLGSTSLLKGIFARPRPFEVLEDVHLKHAWSAGGRSFPSGHTSMAFSIATIVSLQYQRIGVTIPMFLWATLIGYGRVYLGVHYPSDVLGGAILGSGVSLLVWQFRDAFQEASEKMVGKADPVTEAARNGRPVGVDIVRLVFPLD